MIFPKVYSRNSDRLDKCQSWKKLEKLIASKSFFCNGLYILVNLWRGILLCDVVEETSSNVSGLEISVVHWA